MSEIVSVSQLTELVTRVFVRHGVRPDNAAPVADTVVAAERDGSASHGLLRLPGYVATLKSGWVVGAAEPVVVDAAPGLIATDAANGFAQPALLASASLLRDKTRQQGIAALAIRNSHHFAALWPDIEPFAAEGFITLAMVNGRRRMAVWNGRQKILGTNPMAFACPRTGRPPLVWDQASSVIAQGEVLLAAEHGRALPAGVGLDADGLPTLHPRAVLDGGSLSPFGGHKGSSIAFMVEILAGALTGGCFGFEDRSAGYLGAQTSKAGQTVILIDPSRVPDNRYFERIETLFAAITESGVERLPAEHRYRRREQAGRDGIAVADRDWAKLQEFLA
ncbi:MAG TPA: Ldh family oxidoreductase [Stellaceae bacterium]|jgi:delta1-piperideine-2-carboxylate reductase|nr:Ldh family oxidoreductase [Stellaceae bacterium]